MSRATSTLAGVLALAATAVAATVSIQEWPVPWPESRPRDPFVGPQGRVWFVGQTGHYLAWLDPATGRFEKVALEEGTGPHNLVVSPAGDVWFAGNRKGYIGRLTPSTGAIRRYPMPRSDAEDPHTLVFGRDEVLWFTLQMSNLVGRLDTRTGEVKLVDLPKAGSRPYGIVVDSRGRPWFNEFGTNRIGTLDPATLELREYVLRDPGARSRRIAVTKDDRIWFVDYARGFLGRLDPASGEVREWPMPAGDQSLPYALAADDRDRLWVVETGPQPNRLVGFDAESGRVLSATPIPSGGGTVRHMVFHEETHSLWFGTDHDTIGRALVP